MSVTVANKEKKDVISVEVMRGVNAQLMIAGIPVAVGAPFRRDEFSAWPIDNLGIETGVVQMEVRVTRPDVYAFMVDGKKNVSLAKDDRESVDASFNGRIYKVGIKVKEKESVSYTVYPMNNIRLVQVDTDGKFRTFELSLVSHGGQFNLGFQKIYESAIFVRKGEFACPMFETKASRKGWPSFVEMILPLAKKLGIKPESIFNYRLPKVVKFELGKNEAVTRWFNFAQSIGLVDTVEGPARVHWGSIMGRTPAYTIPGERMKFRQLVVPIATMGRTTRFKREAVDVSAAVVLRKRKTSETAVTA